MEKKIGKFLYWTPRILSIIFILSLLLLSLDVFAEGLSFWETALGLFMHNIPALVLLIALLISWKYEIVGGIVFILAGIFYIAWLLMTAITTSFEWYYLLWAIQVSGIAFFIGILFLVNWFKKKK
ncbi:MAG TPA: hypothetical protein VJK07_01890 [Candidatus Nanoarchaeia archaeon]|nr:hypothetical protein [Candidatus Nanoarchaeia archaeon]